MVEYSDEIAGKICEALADARSLRSICCDESMPSQSTVFRWLADERYTSFREQYARAREAQADALFDEMLDIADNSTNDWMERHGDDGENIGWRENGEAMQRAKLRVDTRKWMAAKLRPKVYGDATLLKHADADGEKLDMASSIAQRRRQVAAGRDADEV